MTRSPEVAACLPAFRPLVAAVDAAVLLWAAAGPGPATGRHGNAAVLAQRAELHLRAVDWVRTDLRYGSDGDSAVWAEFDADQAFVAPVEALVDRFTESGGRSRLTFAADRTGNPDGVTVRLYLEPPRKPARKPAREARSRARARRGA